MKDINEKLSAIIDDELINDELIDDLLNDEECQASFYRYHLIGDVMRDEAPHQLLEIDISQQVMSRIEEQSVDTLIEPVIATDNVVDMPATKAKIYPENNVISFAKRFGQYAIAASVAGVVVVSSLMTSQPAIENNGLEVLKTVPFGGATPVSLQATQQQSQQAVKDYNERLDALLKDHQLQLQTQP
ncbi:MAG: sigma-E factor negative regulatory protein [Psychromonas sp.]